MKAETRHPARQVRTRTAVSATACTECPVCGSEECLVLEELGSYCATMTAASLAKKEEAVPKKA